MRILKGFTLAEVLITLGIVGVIAALTLPSLFNNVEAQKAGPSLAKAINTLEDANKKALAENHVEKLNRIRDFDYMNNVIVPYIVGAPFGAITDQYPLEKSGLANFTNLNAYTSKDGITYIPRDLEGATNVHPAYQEVFIDINGPDVGPNRSGRDFFYVRVVVDGRIIPFGSRQDMNFINNGDGTFWNAHHNCDATAVNNGLSCTGSIADNNWTVIYDY